MENWLTTRRLGIGLALIVVLGAGVHFYQESVEKKEVESRSALYEIQKTYDAELTALPEAERATTAGVDVDAKFPKTVAALNQMIDSKKVSSRVLFEATMKLGSLYLDRGQADKAVAVFKKMPDFASTAFQKASAYYLLGSAQERAGQEKEANATFQQGLQKEVEGLKAEFLLGIVRSFVKTNEIEKAKPYLEKLRKDLPGTKALETAESLIGK